jgi:hypothetical protein
MANDRPDAGGSNSKGGGTLTSSSLRDMSDSIFNADIVVRAMSFHTATRQNPMFDNEDRR